MKTTSTQNPRTRNLASKSFTPFIVASLLILTGAVKGVDRDWDAGGGGDTDFHTAANWTGDTVPVAGDNALVNGIVTITADITSSGSRLNVLEVGRWGGSGTVTQTAGTLYTAGFNVGFIGTGVYNLNGGSISMNNDFLLGHSGGGLDSGNGTFNMNTTGSFDANYLKIADSDWGSKMSTGAFNLSAGTVNSTWGVRVGGAASKNGLGTMNLSGGTVNSGGNFVIGDSWEGAKGVFNMTGGTLNVTGANGTEFWVGNGHAGDYSTYGSGSATNSSGTLNVGSWFVVGRDGAQGTLTISGDAVVNQGVNDPGANMELGNFGAGGTATVHLNGGTLAVNGIYDNGGAGSATTFNFNGGTLKARKNNDWQFMIADTVNVKDGGAVIDSSGFNIRIDQVLLASGTGGLTKNGAGQLELSAANTFTGPVVINSGSLYANYFGQNNTVFSHVSDITVNSGATLRSSGNSLFGWDGTQAKPITVNAGGTLTLNDNNDVTVGIVILNGGTLAGVGTGAFGSWNFGRYGVSKLVATENSTVSATWVGFHNNAPIEVAAGKTLSFTGSIDDDWNGGSSVTKIGAGTLVLSGVSTYTGSTVISNGTVLVNGSLASGSAVAVNGGTLGGTGTLGGAVTVNSGGTLTPGASIGTLTLGSLTLNSGATAAMEIGNGPSGDKASASGVVTYAGTLKLIWTGATPAAGTVDLFDGASFSGAFSSLQFSNWPSAFRVNTNNLTTDGSISIAANAAPTAAHLVLGVSQGNSATLVVIGGKHSPTDADGDVLAITDVTQPAQGSVTFTSTGVTYNATGAAGTCTFDYTVSDPFGATDTKSVTVTVTPYASTGANIVPGSFSVNGSNVQLDAFGIPGATYRLEYTSSLTAPINWVDLPASDLVAGTNGLLDFNYTHTEALPGSGFFRTKYVSGP